MSYEAYKQRIRLYGPTGEPERGKWSGGLEPDRSHDADEPSSSWYSPDEEDLIERPYTCERCRLSMCDNNQECFCKCHGEP